MKQSKIIVLTSLLVFIIQFEKLPIEAAAAIGPILPIVRAALPSLFKSAAKTGIKETANNGMKGAVKETAKSSGRGAGQSIKPIVAKETAKSGLKVTPKDFSKSSSRNTVQNIKSDAKESAKASMKSGTKETVKSSNKALQNTNVKPVENSKVSSRGVGQSGQPKLHFPKFSSLKKAKDAAKQASHSKGGLPKKHSGKQGERNHFHAVDKNGQEMKSGKYGGVHFQFDKKIGK